MKDLFKQILLANVYDVAKRSPLELAEKMSKKFACNIFLKREDLQSVHSFKLRGAYNKISQLSNNEMECGVITASAGNHAQGVALAAKRLGLSALIVMPKTTPQIKIDAVKSYGADVELYGDNYSEAADYCKKRVKETGRTFIHPFNDLLVIAGQGTIVREIVEQLPDLDMIFVPVGGGDLIAGIAQYVKELYPAVKIIGVEPADSNAMQKSLECGKCVQLSNVGIFADGVAVKQVGENTFKIAQKYVDECITVDTDHICAATKAIFEETRSIVEPAGALAIVGIMTYLENHEFCNKNTVAICSGANMAFERLQFIAERTLLGSGNEVIFMVDLLEKAGSLKEFCRGVVNGNHITQFAYRLKSRNKAKILIGFSLKSKNESYEIQNRMIEHEYEFTNISNDDIAKEHVRHMVGGPSLKTRDEHLYQVLFP